VPNPFYLIEANFGRGRAFIETDRDQNSREHVIGLIRSGEVDPVKVLLVDEDGGRVWDVTTEILESARLEEGTEILSRFARKWEDFRASSRQAAAFDHAHDLRKNWVA